MATENIFKEINTFMKAQGKAEEAHKEEFKCPLCGGDAWWKRSSYNNHLHCGCCTIRELTCCDCPLWDNKTSKCRPWRDDEVAEAVYMLNGERRAE